MVRPHDAAVREGECESPQPADRGRPDLPPDGVAT